MTERPANGGLLQSGGQCPRSRFRGLTGEFAEELRPRWGKFPVSGDQAERGFDHNCVAELAVNLVNSRLAAR